MIILRLLLLISAVASYGWAEVEASWVPARVVGIEYPLLALQSRTHGIVKVKCTIASDGTVSEAKIMSGSLLLGGSILERIGQWRFRVTPTNSPRPAGIVNLTFTFVLEEAAQTPPKTKFIYDYPYDVTVTSQPGFRSH